MITSLTILVILMMSSLLATAATPDNAVMIYNNMDTKINFHAYDADDPNKWRMSCAWGDIEPGHHAVVYRGDQERCGNYDALSIRVHKFGFTDDGRLGWIFVTETRVPRVMSLDCRWDDYCSLVW